MTADETGPQADPLLMVDITITEFIEGRKTNECKLHACRTGDYLSTAERALTALAGTGSHDPESEAPA